MVTSRYRNYSFILYPEDDLADYQWVDWLRSKHVETLAIKHEPEDNEKKEHVHVLVHFDNPQPRKYVTELFNHIHVPRTGSPDFFSPVPSVRGLERYFLHIDEPGKIQYSPESLYMLNGYTIHLDADNDTASPVRVLYAMARDSHDYQEFLVRVADNRPDLLGYVASHTYFFMSLFA